MMLFDEHLSDLEKSFAWWRRKNEKKEERTSGAKNKKTTLWLIYGRKLKQSLPVICEHFTMQIVQTFFATFKTQGGQRERSSKKWKLNLTSSRSCT